LPKCNSRRFRTDTFIAIAYRWQAADSVAALVQPLARRDRRAAASGLRRSSARRSGGSRFLALFGRDHVADVLNAVRSSS